MKIKTAVEIVRLCLEDNKNFNVINALKTLIKFANDADRYRWRDLRKDPDDLEELLTIGDNDEILVYNDCNASEYMVVRGWYVKGCINSGEHFADAWKFIDLLS